MPGLLCAVLSINYWGADNHVPEYYSLMRTDSVVLVLDDLTPNILHSSYYFSDSNQIYFFANGRLVSYDVDAGKQVNAFKLDVREYREISCLNVLSEDSILLVDYYSNSIIPYYGQKYGKKLTIPSEVEVPMTSATPLFSNGSYCYFTSVDSNTKWSLYSVNMINGVVDHYLRFPGMYKYNWGGFLMTIPYATYNRSENKIIVSFPPDHFIYSIDCDTKAIEKHYVESKHIDLISPLSMIKRMNIPNEKEIEHYNKIDTYSNILYDKYRNVYYRIVEHPNPGKIRLESKNLSVIILDSRFEVLGESKINDKIISSYRYTSFVSERGLNLQLCSTDEYVVFGVYELFSE